MLLGTLVAGLLGNMFAGKPKLPRQEVIRASEGVICASEGAIRASQDFLSRFIL